MFRPGNIVSGFHAIEESIKSGAGTDSGGRPLLLYSKPGPRVKKILERAKVSGIPSRLTTLEELDLLAAALDESARDHRGLLLVIEGAAPQSVNTVTFDDFISRQLYAQKKESDSPDSKSGVTSLVLLLDSITDPHNIGAILRSCDQFAVDLVVLPEHNSAKEGGIVARSSAGASSWVPQSTVTSLSRAAEKLKNCGYWIYGAEAAGVAVHESGMSGKVALVLGSEGCGISRLLREKCDKFVSIPTMGKLDSLNVSVACGILLYEVRRKK